MANANAVTVQSMLMVEARGRIVSASRTKPRTIQLAAASPSTPPTSESATLSSTSWRARSRCVAPSAVRTANSRRRARPEASKQIRDVRAGDEQDEDTAPISRRSCQRDAADEWRR